LVEVSTDLYVESFALKFEISKRIVSDQPDQFAQLVHVDRSFEMLRQRTMPAAAAISITMTTVGTRLVGLFG
jgi:hypothetical protein